MDDATKYGSMPISMSRVIAPTASFVCSVLNTKWPVSEARIAMVFGVPLTIIGARLGVSSSSYANKRSDRESFWDEHLAPLYKEMSGPLNSRPKDVRRVGLTADFPGVQEVAFDLSDVRALQEDQDKIHARYRANLQAGGMTMEEFREKTGLAAEVPSAGTFLIPSNMVAVPAADVRAGRVGLAPEEPVESAPAAGG
jgi:phage portal protein BeeE